MQTISLTNRRLRRRLLLLVAAMFGFGFALVPLYNVFCDITGLNGKTNTTAAAVTPGEIDTERTVTVEFVAHTNVAAPWEFAPVVTKMQVHPGEFYRTSYYAQNLSPQALIGQAIPSVAPGQAARYFHKIECFCFTRQAFAPNEGKDMPVAFMVDPELPKGISTLTLSYTFFKLEDQDG